MNNKLIEKINQLYIMTRKQYLILNPIGTYNTLNTTKQKGAFPLNDGIVKKHIEGKSTLGVFAGKEFTKFICFDVDVIDQKKAKWVVYRLIENIKLLGIPEDKIYISLSGNKGYHVEIFFSNPVRNKLAFDFYQLVMIKSGMNTIDYGQVEFRPIGLNNGVKIPLGINFKSKTNNICWYVDYHGLQPIESYEYILNIEQMDVSILYDIMECEENLYIEDQVIEVEEERQDIESQIKPLEIYKQNIDENETIEAIKDLYLNGLKSVGTRNNSLFKLAKYFYYMGLNKEECKDHLIEWMSNQDKSKYTSTWETCLKEIEHIHNYIYDNDVRLIIKNEHIEITYDEMVQILKLSSKNEKILSYCLLLHSKRFSNKNGIFYMSYNQMEIASNLGSATVKRLIKKLSENKTVEMVSNDQKQKGTYKKKPNKYKLNIQSKQSDNKYIYNVNNLNYNQTYKDCLTHLFDMNTLKYNMSKREYNSLFNSNLQI